MENFLPNPVRDSSHFRHDWNKLLDWARRNTIQSSGDVYIKQDTHGTSLQVADWIKYKVGGGGMNWAGVFNETGSYNINDVVLVDANTTYTASFEVPSGSTVPALCPGLFLCLINVPGSGSGRNSLNVYYPIYPTIPSSSVVTVSGSLANQTFWQPLSPQKKMNVCIDGQPVVAYVNCVLSGSVFSSSQLPYP